jgi:hypothetical protein
MIILSIYLAIALLVLLRCFQFKDEIAEVVNVRLGTKISPAAKALWITSAVFVVALTWPILIFRMFSSEEK